MARTRIFGDGAAFTVKDSFAELESIGRRYNDTVTTNISIPIEPENLGGNVWTTRTALTAAKDNLAGFSLDGFGYVCGGSSSDRTAMNNVDQYNDSLNSWAIRNPLFAQHRSYNGFDLNGLGYVTGGYNQSAIVINTVEQYDDVKDSWLNKAALTTSKSSMGDFSLNGFGYACGGFSSSYLNEVHRYNDSLNTWSTVASSLSKAFTAGFSLNNFGYLCGGGTASAVATNTVEFYNDSINIWTAINSIGNSRRELSGISVGGFGYVVGGFSDSSTNSSEVNQYNDINRVWTTKYNAGTARKGHNDGFALNGYGYISGGFVSAVSNEVNQYRDHNDYYIQDVIKRSVKTPVSVYVSTQVNHRATNLPIQIRTDQTNWQYGFSNTISLVKSGQTITSTFAADASNRRTYEIKVGLPNFVAGLGGLFETTRQNMPTAKEAAGSWNLGGWGYVAGGYTTVPINENVQFNELNNIWTTKTSATTAGFYAPGAFNLGGLGYIYGGIVSGSTFQNVTEQYNADTNAWATKAVLLYRTNAPSGFSLNGFGYAAMGNAISPPSDNVLEQYNDALNTWTQKAYVTGLTLRKGTAFSVYGLGYACGGASISEVDQYNDSADSWLVKANMPTDNAGMTSFNLVSYGTGTMSPLGVGSFSLTSYAYVCGGYSTGGYMNTIWQYNSNANNWVVKTPLGNALLARTSFVSGDSAFLTGGSTPLASITTQLKCSENYINLNVTMKVVEY